MQTPVSSNIGMLGFQLPRLSEAVRTSVSIRSANPALARAALDLIEIGIIEPSSVPQYVTSPGEVLKHGLDAWLEKNVGSLNHLRIQMYLCESKVAQGLLPSYANSEQRTFGGNPVLGLALTEDQEAEYTLHRCAEQLEQVKPGLFGTAINAIEQASYLTAYVRLPSHMYYEFTSSYWDAWCEEKVTEKSAREALVERLGEEADIESYLPRNVQPVFGFNLWDSKRRANKLSVRSLRAFKNACSLDLARTVAEETATLLKLCKDAKESNAALPTLEGIELAPSHSSCHLMYQDHDFVWDMWDDQVNHIMQVGNGTDLLGLEELPSGAEALAVYFKKLCKALAVTKQMDKVIGLIAEPLVRKGK